MTPFSTGERGLLVPGGECEFAGVQPPTALDPSGLKRCILRLQVPGSTDLVGAPEPRSRLWDIAAGMAVFVVAFWTQRWVLHLPLTAIDTIPTLAAARVEHWTEILDVLARELRGGADENYYYRPLTLISYTLDQFVWGGSAWGYHFTDVILHGLAGAAVFALARVAFDLSRLAALGVAALFLIHPAVIEVVPAIARRQEPLLVIGFCVALIGSRRVPEHVGWLLMVLGSLVAVTSVERGLAVPALVFGYLLLYRFAGSGFIARIYASVRWTLPSVLVAMGFFVLRWMLYGPRGVWLRAENFVYVPAHFGFALIYPQQVINFVAPKSAVQAVVYLAVILPIATALSYTILRAHRRELLWCGLCWIGSYVLLLSVAGFLNPWYVYTAVPGLALIIAFFAIEARRLILDGGPAWLRAGSAASVVLLFSALFAVSSPVWRDYPAWRVSGGLSERFLGELARLSLIFPDREPFMIINLPSHFRESDSDFLVTCSAAILWPSSVEVWQQEQNNKHDVTMIGSADFVKEASIPEIEFTEDSVRIYFVEGNSSYTNSNGVWPEAERLPTAVGRGFSFPWPGGSETAENTHIFVFDGKRLVPYEG